MRRYHIYKISDRPFKTYDLLKKITFTTYIKEILSFAPRYTDNGGRPQISGKACGRPQITGENRFVHIYLPLLWGSRPEAKN
jgi:hypothetical protein